MYAFFLELVHFVTLPLMLHIKCCFAIYRFTLWQFYVLNTAACIALCGLYIRHVNFAIVAGFRTVTGRS